MKTRYRLLVLSLLVFCALLWLTPIAPSYAEEGLATWYGPGFQGRPMANGQIFDMNDPTTTACNLYPLGTWLRVTNPANGKSIVVQVRDRGAFRIALDLSYGAFRALGGVGTMMRVYFEPVSGPEAAPEPENTPLPTPTPAPPPTATLAPEPATPSEHTVQPGETLSAIAAQYGLSVEELARLNGIEDPDRINEGQHLRLVAAAGEAEAQPAPEVSAASVAPEVSSQSSEPPPSSSLAYYHTVREGETLWDIALQYRLTPEQLIQMNNLGDANSLQVGQSLYISQAYEVAAGDTLSRIAAEYGVSVESLMQANGLGDDSIIQPGEKLRIPKP